MLEQTFKALHFNVVLHPLLGGKQIISCLTEILKQEQNLKGDAFVCCIISRGTANHLLGIDSYGMGVSLDHVRQSFTGNACPMLAGKPKLFFIQTYSLDEGGSCDRIEHRDGDIEIDGCNGPLTSSYIPSEADMFWSHCLTDVSQLDQGGHHSVYLRTLTAALENARIRFEEKQSGVNFNNHYASQWLNCGCLWFWQESWSGRCSYQSKWSRIWAQLEKSHIGLSHQCKTHSEKKSLFTLEIQTTTLTRLPGFTALHSRRIYLV